MPDWIVEIEGDGRITESNRSFGGVEREELQGGNWYDFLIVSERERAKELVRRALTEQRPITSESPNVVAAEEQRWFQITVAPSGAKCCTLHCRDVTVIHRRNRYLELVIDSTPSGLLVVDEHGVIIMANRALKRLLGYTAEELVGQPVEMLVPNQARDEHIGDRHRYMASPTARGVAGGRVVEAIAKDGSTIPVEVALTPLSPNPRSEVLCSVTDVRERMQLEAQLRQSQRLETIGLLAGGVAHDFNNVLTAILSFGDFVLKELPEGSTARDDMVEVLEAARRATTLTSQLLAFSRRQPLAPKVLDLLGLLEQLQKLLQRVIGEDIKLSIDIDDDLATVMVDPGAVEHILLNLAVNARDAMPRGGELRLSCSNETLDPPTLERAGASVPAGQYVRVRVEDTGSGMTPDVCARIFEPFFTTKTAGRGTGLGLSTVHGMVSQLGGVIVVDSEPGRGTIFDIYLPTASRAQSRHAPTSDHPPPTGAERILVVEDDDQVRAVIRRCLARLGYHVVTASTGMEALDIVERDDRFDLIVSDLVMPDINGADLAERLSERVSAQTLFISGYAPEAVKKRGIIATGELMQKPFTASELGERVRDLLDRRR